MLRLAQSFPIILLAVLLSVPGSAQNSSGFSIKSIVDSSGKAKRSQLARRQSGRMRAEVGALSPTVLMEVHEELASTELDDSFNSFKAKFGKTYADGSAEHHLRKKQFQLSLAQVTEHNGRGEDWRAAINRFADWTQEELKRLHGYKRTPSARGGATPSLLEQRRVESCSQKSQICGTGSACCGSLVCGNSGMCSEPTDELPSLVDYQHLSSYNEVQDQGGCGGCWAVAATSAVQLQAELRAKKGVTPVALSAQGVLGCTPNPHKCGGEGGCKGSTPELAYVWMMENGITKASEHPYIAETTCPIGLSDGLAGGPKDHALLAVNSQKAAAHIGGFVAIPANSPSETVMRALVEAGPLAVAVAAGKFSFYDSGILNCGSSDWTINHAVLLVGYGEGNPSPSSSLFGELSSLSASSKMYWKIRNSWGPDWGEKGFVRIQRQGAGADLKRCGTDTDMQAGVACEGDAKEATVCGECGILSDITYPTLSDFAAPH